MDAFQRRIFRTLAALLALLVFSGDVLDDVWNVPSSTTTHSSDQQKGSAPSIGSASHDDAVVIDGPFRGLTPAPPSAFKYSDVDEAAPVGALPSIDHPPQLA